jgi:pantothenate kinase
LQQSLDRLLTALVPGRRYMLGLAGAPGAGKSTVAQRLLDALPGRAVVVPMDGYHLANTELARLGRAGRKGAPDTFDIELVITEGNYLLLDQGHWAGVRAQLDAVWSVDVDSDLRRERLAARHMRYGRTAEQAHAWVWQTDEPNAVLVVASKVRADLVLR